MNHVLLILTLCCAGISATSGAERRHTAPAWARILQLEHRRMMTNAINIHCTPTPHLCDAPDLVTAYFDLNPETARCNKLDATVLAMTGPGVSDNLNPEGYQAVSATHFWFLYPVKLVAGIYYIYTHRVLDVSPGGVPDESDGQYWEFIVTASWAVGQTHWLLFKVGPAGFSGYRFDAVSGGSFSLTDYGTTLFSPGTYADALEDLGLVEQRFASADSHTEGDRIGRVCAGSTEVIVSPFDAAYCPAYRDNHALLNGHDALEFTQAALEGMVFNLSLVNDFTIYAVWRPTATSAGLTRHLIGSKTTDWVIGPMLGLVNCYTEEGPVGDGIAEGTTIAKSSTHVQCVTFRMTGAIRYARNYRNGVNAQGEVASGSSPIEDITLGGANIFSTDGADALLARLIIYNGAHSAATVATNSAALLTTYLTP